MAKKSKKARSPKQDKNAYQMPPPVPAGTVLEIDNTKYKLGPSIGVGGFGEIYTACVDEGNTSNDYDYVVKIEPVENGPLFVEMHFYDRNYDEDAIKTFIASRKLPGLGMPRYLGSGTFHQEDEELRFLIVERYGKDLWKVFKEVGGRFPAPTAFQIGLQILDVLEYIHGRSYIHADVKGANILLGRAGAERQTFLLDFGLAYRIVEDNYLPRANNAHEGTIEYTSTDRHVGAKTMRGDLEILGYNLLHWVTGALPWGHVLEHPTKVQRLKKDFMKDPKAALEKYPDVPHALVEFFEYIKTLEQGDVPDYDKCRPIFEDYLASVGKTRTSDLDFPFYEDTNGNNDQENKQPADDKKEKEEKVTKPKKTTKDVIEAVVENGDVKEVKIGRKRRSDRNEASSAEEPAMKKRKSLRVTTPEKKAGKETKAKPENDSENELKENKRRSKNRKISEVPATAGTPRTMVYNLRCFGKKTRPCYKE